MILTALYLILAGVIPGLAPAYGQDDGAPKSGLRYTTAGARDENAQSGTLHHKSFKQKQAAPAPKAEETSPADEVWDKYKALAAGQYLDAPDNTPADKTAATPQPEKQEPGQAAPQPAAPAAGLAGLLADYNKTKARRSQMRTLRVNGDREPADENPPE